MIKKSMLFVPFILSTLLVGSQFGHCAFNVEIDDHFDYVLGEAALNATIGSNNFQVSGVNINDNNIDEISVISVTVEDILEVGLLFTYSSGVNEMHSIVQNNSIDSMVRTSCVYVFSLTEMFANGWSTLESAFQYGYNILTMPTFIPFIDNKESTWDFIEDYAGSFNRHFSTITSSDYADYTMDYKSETKGDIFLAEWRVEMIDLRSNNEFYANVTGISQYKLAIQKSTGVILGSRYEGSCSGERNGENVDFYASFFIEDVEYNLPEFKLTVSSGMSSIYFITSSVCIFIIVVIFAKRRRN